MAYTVAGLTTQVQNRLDDTGFSTAIILQFLNDAQREYVNNQLTRIMEASQNYTLTPNNFDLTSGAGLPAAFQSVIDLKIITPPGYGNTLFYMDPKEFDINYPTPVLFGLNRPYIFTKYGSLLMVFPTPDSAYVLTLRYYKTPVELVNTTDVPEIPVEWQELLVLGALWRCHQLNDNYDLAAIVQNRVDEQLTQYSQRMSLGKQQPSIMKLNSNTTARR